jgi:hypothetical protein
MSCFLCGLGDEDKDEVGLGGGFVDATEIVDAPDDPGVTAWAVARFAESRLRRHLAGWRGAAADDRWAARAVWTAAAHAAVCRRHHLSQAIEFWRAAPHAYVGPGRPTGQQSGW